MSDDSRSIIVVEGEYEYLDGDSLASLPGETMRAAGEAANYVASRGVFEDYVSRKALNTIIRQRSDLALFAAYLQDMLRGKNSAPNGAQSAPDSEAVNKDSSTPTGRRLQSEPAMWTGVTWGMVEGFKRWLLQRGYAVSSVNIRLSTVKTYARLASKAGVISPEAFIMIKNVEGYRRKEAKHLDERRDIQRVGAKKAQAVSITQEQAAALKNQPDTAQGRRDSLLMCLLLDHGLRCGEVARLSVSDIDLREGVMRFYRPKVDKVQTHKLTSDTLRAAYAWLLGGDAPKEGRLLRASHKGGSLSRIGMTERGITKRVRFLGAAAGLAGLSAHDCRHYWATHAARSGTDAFSLQEAGGWSSLAMPRRYVEAAKIANQGIKGF